MVAAGLQREFEMKALLFACSFCSLLAVYGCTENDRFEELEFRTQELEDKAQDLENKNQELEERIDDLENRV